MTGRALVTGAGKRLGQAMALELARRGLDVAVHYNGSADGAGETAEGVRAAGCKAAVLQADLLDRQAARNLVGHAAEALGGPLTVLVNNASIFEYDSVESVSTESWARNVGSNLEAPVFLTQAFAAEAPAPVADAQGEPVASALVVNLLDQRVRKLTPHFVSYTIAKMGLWAFTQTAARALAPNVRVNAIGPGPTLPGEGQSAEGYAAQRANTVLGRGSNPEDIVGALSYLLTAPSVTGQLICTDGGQHLAWRTPDITGVD